MNKTDILDLVGEFTWLWNDEFFIETEQGNFIWSNPDYPDGDNSIRECKCSFAEYIRGLGLGCGRSKGKHLIRNYCGEDVSYDE